MFNITPSEILTIVVVALIVLGPRRLVEISRRAGQITGQLRRTADELRAGLESEVAPLTQPLEELQSGLAAAGKKLEETADGQLKWVDDPVGDAEADSDAEGDDPEEPAA